MPVEAHAACTCRRGAVDWQMRRRGGKGREKGGRGSGGAWRC